MIKNVDIYKILSNLAQTDLKARSRQSMIVKSAQKYRKMIHSQITKKMSSRFQWRAFVGALTWRARKHFVTYGGHGQQVKCCASATRRAITASWCPKVVPAALTPSEWASSATNL
jgi:hypothetical protein